ncbi:MAG: hypothetical protein IJX37_08150 [Oscillospiraceae bacterium]|nr:hypothetical protein [Oscillospiraceae bacterium]
MKFMEKIRQTWQQFLDSRAMQKTLPVLKKTGYVLALTSKWAYKLRSVLLAIPVAVVAVALAIRNMQQLPSEVGINILASGEYQWMVSRGVAALAPLAVTAVCLGLMFCSKKVLYPWLISLFSLVLPLVIWVTNVFPA